MLKYEMLYQQLCREITASLRAGDKMLQSEAKLCARTGVSRQTLRRALARLKEEHIIESRQGSGYRLTGLYPSRTSRIALLVPSDERYIYPAFITQVTRHFGRLYYQTEIFVTGQDAGTERRILESLLKEPPRALVAFVCGSGRPSPNADLYHALQAAGTDMVFPGGCSPNIHCGMQAAPDETGGADIMTDYLISLGHKRIALLLEEGDRAGEERYLGYCRTLVQHGLSLRDEDVKRIPPYMMEKIRTDRSSRIMDSVMDLIQEEVTAVLCQNDELAFYVIRALQHKGISVPGQVSVAGFDNSHLHGVGRVTLTTMAQTPRSGGEYVCAVLEHLLVPGTGAPPANSWRLVPGASTAARRA